MACYHALKASIYISTSAASFYHRFRRIFHSICQTRRASLVKRCEKKGAFVGDENSQSPTYTIGVKVSFLFSSIKAARLSPQTVWNVI